MSAIDPTLRNLTPIRAILSYDAAGKIHADPSTQAQTRRNELAKKYKGFKGFILGHQAKGIGNVVAYRMQDTRVGVLSIIQAAEGSGWGFDEDGSPDPILIRQLRHTKLSDVERAGISILEITDDPALIREIEDPEEYPGLDALFYEIALKQRQSGASESEIRRKLFLFKLGILIVRNAVGAPETPKPVDPDRPPDISAVTPSPDEQEQWTPAQNEFTGVLSEDQRRTVANLVNWPPERMAQAMNVTARTVKSNLKQATDNLVRAELLSSTNIVDLAVEAGRYEAVPLEEVPEGHTTRLSPMQRAFFARNYNGNDGDAASQQRLAELRDKMGADNEVQAAFMALKDGVIPMIPPVEDD